MHIVIIQGHPNPEGTNFGHALAKAYLDGAIAGGHEVKILDIAKMDFPILQSHEQWLTSPVPPCIAEAQAAIKWADHLVVFFPLWLGTMPGLLKVFFEQLLRPGFGTIPLPNGRGFKSLLNSRSARVVVTMGMPALLYRWYFRARGVKGLEQFMLRSAGIRPIRETFIGSVEKITPEKRKQWLGRLREMGQSSA